MLRRIFIGERRQVPPRKEIVARLLLSLLAGSTSVLSLTARATFSYKMVQAGGQLATCFAVLMGLLGLWLLLDTFINDVLPDRYQIVWSRTHRQFTWLALGLIYMLFGSLVFYASLSPSLGAYLILYALASFMVAFVDASLEKRERRCTP